MIDTIGNRSAQAGYRRSRLPQLTQEDIDYVRGTYDFLGLNTYTTYMVKALEAKDINLAPGWANDAMTDLYQSENWVAGASSWLKVSELLVSFGYDWLYFINLKLTYV